MKMIIKHISDAKCQHQLGVLVGNPPPLRRYRVLVSTAANPKIKSTNLNFFFYVKIDSSKKNEKKN